MNSNQAQGTIDILKSRYFELALKEKRGEAPEITEELDKIENAVSVLKTKITHNEGIHNK